MDDSDRPDSEVAWLIERYGSDGLGDELGRQFVSCQAVRSCLTDYRGAAYEGPTDDEEIRAAIESIQWLLARTLSVIEERIGTVRETGRVDVGAFEVLPDAQVLCQDRGRQYAVTGTARRAGM